LGIIDLNVATSKQIYQNIILDDIPKEIVPKGQTKMLMI